MKTLICIFEMLGSSKHEQTNDVHLTVFALYVVVEANDVLYISADVEFAKGWEGECNMYPELPLPPHQGAYEKHAN